MSNNIPSIKFVIPNPDLLSLPLVGGQIAETIPAIPDKQGQALPE